MLNSEQKWMEMQSPQRHCFARKDWIPVYGMKFNMKEQKYPEINLKEDFIHVESGIVSNEYKDLAEKLSWSDWGQDNVTPYVSKANKYHKSGNIYDREMNKIGERLVMGQYIDADFNNEIYINQDFVLAYKLVRHNDRWIRPKEGDREVIRCFKDEKGDISFVEIRAEFIRDYLYALDSSLRLYYYRERQSIVKIKPDYIQKETVELINEPHHRCTLSCYHITSEGDLPDSNGISVKRSGNSVNERDTIPVSNNIRFASCDTITEFRKTEKPDRYHIHGRLWRAEWINPAKQSSLVGYSEPKDEFMVQVDETNNKVKLSTLKYEEINKYLWFNPEVVNLLVANRGGKIVWDTMETGFVFADPDTSVHFGVNKKGLITVYAFDIAKLPYWQQKIWVSQNCSPNFGISRELSKIQIASTPVDSTAPEQLLFIELSKIEELFQRKFSLKLYRNFSDTQTVTKLIDRFRSLDDDTLRSLANNLHKFCIERINEKQLKKLVRQKDNKFKSIRLLKQFLEEKNDMINFSEYTEPLFALTKLGTYDSLLDSDQNEDKSVYDCLNVNRSDPHIWQGAEMINKIAITFSRLHSAIEQS